MTEQKILVLPPAIIVGTDGIKLRADVSYETLGESEESDRTDEGTTVVVERETRKTIRAREEYDRAAEVVSSCRTVLRRVIRATAIGWLCPVTDEAALDEAFAAIKEACATHNRTARRHFVRASLVKARIASDDESAAREIAGQIRELTEELEAALGEVSPEKIRDAAARLLGFAPIVGATGSAVEAARAAAKAAKAAAKKGEDVESAFAAVDLSPVSALRGLALEWSVPAEVVAAAEGAAAARALELDDSPAAAETAALPQAIEVEAPQPILEPAAAAPMLTLDWTTIEINGRPT